MTASSRTLKQMSFRALVRVRRLYGRRLYGRRLYGRGRSAAFAARRDGVPERSGRASG